MTDSKVESGNPDAKRLYDDLLSNYNKLVRPVANISETVTVHLKLKLSQLIAVVSTLRWMNEWMNDKILQQTVEIAWVAIRHSKSVWSYKDKQRTLSLSLWLFL